MKHVKKFEKYNDTKFNVKNYNSINDILDIFSNNFKNEKLDNNLTMKIERLDNFYRISIINENNELISNVDIQPLKDKKNSYVAENGKFNIEIKNLHVNENFRNNGLGSKLLQKCIDIFGNQNLYIYPNPNRIKNLNKNNKEKYRKSLINFYSRYGFKKIPTSDFGMKR